MSAKHRPNYCLRVMGELFNQCSYLSENEFVRLDTQMTCFADYLGAMERIFKSPIPLPYTRCVFGPEMQRVAVQTKFCKAEALSILGHHHTAHSLLTCRAVQAEVCNANSLLCLTSCMPSPGVHSPPCGLALGLQDYPGSTACFSPSLLPTLVCC